MFGGVRSGGVPAASAVAVCNAVRAVAVADSQWCCGGKWQPAPSSDVVIQPTLVHTKKNHTDISPIFYLLTVNGHLNWEVGSTPKNGKLHVKLKGPLFCFDAKIEIYFGMRSSGMISINVFVRKKTHL